jgi:hypothetical protein
MRIRLNDLPDVAALRVEWCKVYARAKRYTEDVWHLWAEMQRTIAFGCTEAGIWDALAADELPDSTPEINEGRRMYAAEHAETERRTCEQLTAQWTGILQKADAYLDGHSVLDSDEQVLVQLEPGDELDTEEEEAALEGNNE